MKSVPAKATGAQFRLTMPMEGWSIICDFDGTVTPFDVTDAILGRFASSEWETVEEEWLQGRISARECMQSQVGLLRVPRDVLDAFLDTVPIDEGFAGFFQYCEGHGQKLLIVSDGMDYAIRRILARHNLGAIPVIANRLVFLGGDTYKLEFPYGDPGCGSGVCKCRVSGNGEREILLIGDGRSDCCLAGKAACILAKKGKELLRLCEGKGYPHFAYADFFDIRALFAAQNEFPGKERHDSLAGE